MTLFADSFNLNSLLLDLAFASGFILVGQLIRAKVKFFQRFFVPASLIGGFLGLIIGPFGIHAYLPNLPHIPFSGMMGSYAGILIIIIFSSIGIRGFEVSKGGIKSDVERIGSYFSYRQFLFCAQYFIAFVFAFYVLSRFWPELPEGFGLILPAGFAGGHGTAAAVGQTFADYGWVDAKDLAMTSATVGILAGVFGGVFMIKLGTERGYTSYIKNFASLPEELRTGLIPEEKRGSIGSESVSPTSIDPFAWHFALVIFPAGLGWILTNVFKHYWQLNLPSFSVAFLVALCFYFILQKTGAYRYVDRKVCTRVGSFATDFLVFFGVASIKIPILIKYFAPFMLLMLVGLLWTVMTFWVLGAQMVNVNWFERGIFHYGVMTGVYAIGFVLLRIVDPDNKSKTLDDLAITGPIGNVVEILFVSMMPILLSTQKMSTALWITGLGCLACLILSTVMKWWYFKLPKARPQEME